MDPVETVRALAAAPPVHVRDLAAALGCDVGDWLGAGMGAVSAPGVTAAYGWDIHHERPVGSAQALAGRELTSYALHFGAGRARLGEVGGALAVSALADDGFVLSWPAPEPLGDPAELAARVRAAAAPGELSLEQPVAALALAEALGALGAFAHTVDVHMSSWVVELRCAGWTVRARLSGSPSGEPVPGVSLPAALARGLGREDVVRSMQLRRSDG